ncbi:MAG: SpoIVB peptidase, partial [Clostridia bacterium]|nr:SpoIVB peptidase [Clostridia bacterium]
IELGSRFAVKPGKAYIRTQADGTGVKDYEIKIIKAVKQKRASEKSIVFKVVDKNLLTLTNGIVQGMSGSPIIQDGRLVGSVTHVFLNDSTKGYGVYIDWMLEQ